MRWGVVGASLLVASEVAVVACDEIEREPPSRYYVAPDADTGDGSRGTVADASVIPDAPVDAPTDAQKELLGIPTTMPLTGWWRATYTGSPWVGLPSMGPSAGRALGEVTSPPIAGTPLNGFAPASFDGMDDKLTSELPLTDYFSTTAWEVHGLFSADSAAPYKAGAPYDAPALVADSSKAARFYVGFSAAGVVAGHYDGVSFKEIVQPCAPGGLHAFQVWFDGKALNLVVDGGAPAPPVPAGAAIFTTGLLRVGANYSVAAALDGRVFDLLTSKTLLGPAGRAAVRVYYNSRYGTSFPQE